MGLSRAVTRSILPSRNRPDAHTNTQYICSHLASFLVDGGWTIVSGITRCAREATRRQGCGEKKQVAVAAGPQNPPFSDSYQEVNYDISLTFPAYRGSATYLDHGHFRLNQPRTEYNPAWGKDRTKE